MFKGGKPPGRYIPGGPIPGAPAGSAPNTDGGKKKKNNKKKGRGEGENGIVSPAPAAPVEEMANATISGASPADEATAKKIRNVEKKVSAALKHIPCGPRNRDADDRTAQKH